MENFRIAKWALHEIKDLNLKNRALSGKLEELISKDKPSTREGAKWTEDEKLIVADSIHKTI